MRSPIWRLVRPLGQEVEERALLGRELAQEVVVVPSPQPLEHPAGQARVDQGLATTDAPDGVDEVGAPAPA
jgi:hypothetical protein